VSARSPLGHAINRLVVRTTLVLTALAVLVVNAQYNLLGGAA
jgi:hypothetical protein